MLTAKTRPASLAAIRAAAELELRRRAGSVDPLRRLLDPTFTDRLWEYEYSQTDPDIPGNLHAKQQNALGSQAKHRWLFWGNQTGKTTLGAVDTVLKALGRHPYRQYWKPPVTIWASALTWDLWESILLPELLTWIPKDRIITSPSPRRHSTNRVIEIRADNGTTSRIIGKSAEQGADKYQSARVHHVWLDEEHPESVWNEMQPRLLRFGGTTLATMTPLKGFSWVYHRIYEPWKNGKSDPQLHFCSHAGLSDNPAIGQTEIDALSDALKHNRAQLAARLSGAFVAPEGLALGFDPEVHPEALTDDRARELVAMGQAFGGIDFGHWRFAFTLWAADRDGVVHQIDEYFDQRSTDVNLSPLERRAKAIAEMCRKYGCPDSLRIWGDAANPTDIAELNTHLRRQDGIRYGVVPVAMENKLRNASVERLNDLLGRRAIRFRRGVMAGKAWLLGLNAASSGTPVEGSRLIWEMQNWCYPNPQEGKAQEQDPNDHSADGADAIASMRYAVMSWWRPAKAEQKPEKRNRNKDQGLERLIARMNQGKRVA